MNALGQNLEELKELLKKQRGPYTIDFHTERPVTRAELGVITRRIEDGGFPLLRPAEWGDDRRTVRLTADGGGYGFIMPAVPLAVMITAIVGVVGLTGVIGWRISDIIQDWAPLLIVGGLIVGLIYFKQKR